MSSKNSKSKHSSHSALNSLENVHEKVVDSISDALDEDGSVLLEALPATGKSRGLLKAAKRTGEPITIFTQRGREEQYAQYERWCNKDGLDCKVIPSAHEACPTFQGNHGKKWKKQVRGLRNAGATPRHIHGRLNLPCQSGEGCPYEDAIDFDPTDYDVLVGHPTHAYVEQYVEGRVPVYDEFPGDAYLEKITDTKRAITGFLHSHNLPYGDFGELLADRRDVACRKKALKLLQDCQLVDEQRLFNSQSRIGHKLAGLGTLTLLESEDLGNGWEQAILGNGRVGLYDREESDIYILNPPTLPDTVLGLDGTPTKSMWDIALGFYDRRHRLNLQRVLDDRERRDYLTKIQHLRIVPTTTNVRPYSGGNTTPKRDAALLYEIESESVGEMGVISSKAGIRDVNEELGDFSNWKSTHFGNLLGSNKLGSVDVGVILGSTHYGDRFVEKWGALAGQPIESNGEQGLAKSYGDLGDEILHHMREHRVLQALFRFAREGDGATVYVDTVVLPDWVPVTASPEETSIKMRSDSEDNVLTTLRSLNEGRTKTIAEEAGHSPRTVRKVLNNLPESIVSKHPAEDGRGGAKVWRDENIVSLNPHGRVGLPTSNRQTRFSVQSPYRVNKGSVPKNTPHQQRVQDKREARTQFERRKQRWTQQMQMERRYNAD